MSTAGYAAPPSDALAPCSRSAWQ